MSEQIQTVAGFKVVAFKVEPTRSHIQQGRCMVSVDAFRVRLWLDGAGARPESTIWSAGAHCKERLFASGDKARANVLKTYGHIQER